MISNRWTPVPESQRFGIAIHNFDGHGVHRLRLTLGSGVIVLSECESWYYGYKLENRALHGIFPKAYIRHREAKIIRAGFSEEVVLEQPQIVAEITSVLREWYSLLSNLYTSNSVHFGTIKSKMYELMAFRSQIISGKFPVDELKQIKRVVTSKIDVGNKILGLDMVVRDDQGDILNPESTSTVELFKRHQIATERILRAMNDPALKDPPRSSVNHLYHSDFSASSSGSQQTSWSLLVQLRHLECRLMGDSSELLLCLYDAKDASPFTENVRILRGGNNSAEGSPINHRLLFTDLGTRDVTREKVYLVCYVVRLGAMDTPSNKSNKNSIASALGSSSPVITSAQLLNAELLMRRPYGVAAKDITLILNGKLGSGDDDLVTLPLVPCGEKDNLESTLKKIMLTKDLTHKDHKGQGLKVTLRMLHGDLKQVREENPHVVHGHVSVARKMGFPEVILPGDVRNDLYLTLVCGEFSKGSKSTDKNVQVTTTVCSEKGQQLQGVIQNGIEENEYRSVIYYHEDRPRWVETLKVAVPIEEFKVSHLKFTFKHRSSNETKDKNEKPFAMSFVKLMQTNGTTLPDTTHELLVYKVDHKKWDPSDTSYLNLPSTRSQLEDGSKPSTNGLSLTNKDSFLIQTNVCSTKLTQNIDLLSLLNWANQPEGVRESLRALGKVGGEEVVKFLQDVLDALFNILQAFDSEIDEKMVFECLLYIIGLVSDRKYQHFQPVLELYINESFCATLAYSKLIVLLKDFIEKAESPDRHEREILMKTMKSLFYIIKFIVRSRQLYSDLNGGKDEEEFTGSVTAVLQSLSALMCFNSDSTLLIQGACLKYLPSVIADLITVYNPVVLSEMLVELIDSMPPQRLTKQKMMTLLDIVHSPLFSMPECRRKILPDILLHIRDLLEAKDEEFRIKTKSVAKVAKVLGESEARLQDLQDVNISQVLTPVKIDAKENEIACYFLIYLLPVLKVELCVNILSDIMELLFRDTISSTVHDLSVTMYTVLRTVIQTTIAMDREGSLVGGLVAIMLAVLRQMGLQHFEEYIKRFPTNTDLLDFLMEILLVFKDLVTRPVFPSDWFEMIMLQSSIILKSLRFFSHTIRDYFSQNFEHQAWNNFFHCAIAFLTQPALQLETFSPAKRRRTIARYKDMRMETGFEIRSMWFNLGQHKKQFIPGLVGPFLEMTLIPEVELRKATLPIFFDMMQCEFYSQKEHGPDSRRDSTHIKANFNEFENEMISKLDNLVEAGKGDVQYKELFYSTVSSLCENHATLKDLGLKFVRTVARLMERLLEYRCIIHDENKENRMSCTVNLLDFYSEINRKEMYVRYLNKLTDLHLECDNYTEAAYTLKLYSKLLSWSEAPLPSYLRGGRYSHCTTHRQLKEALYQNIIHYFDLGKMWECAVEACKELAQQYEEHTYDLKRLSTLLRDMAQFYDNITMKLRPKPEYFRVAFYGRGFPPFLQNKVFIYRGKEYERLIEFQSRTLNQLPKAELMNTLTTPGEDITESNGQYVQINKVEPMKDEKKQRHSSGQHVYSQISKYHKVNNVQKFRFSRPYHKRDSTISTNSSIVSSASLNVEQPPQTVNSNEFATLWLERSIMVTSYPLPGILRWFPVTSTQVYKVSPLANAIETMQAANESLRETILDYKNDPHLPLNPLSLRLSGMVDPAVMGGITNYEKAFFTSDYLERHPDSASQVSQLKDLIACQVPLLDIGIKIHGDYAPPQLQPLQLRLEECFASMQAHVIKNYGVKTCDIKYESVALRRQSAIGGHHGDNNRLSGASLGSAEGSRSRVSSLTRSQVASLKTFVNFAAISPSATLSRAGSVYVRSPSTYSTSTMNSGSTSTTSRKEKKKKRRHTTVKDGTNHSFTSSGGGGDDSPRPSSQWYTCPPPPVASIASSPSTSLPPPTPEDSPSTPLFELRQQLTPTRPLRSEVEKERRLSRPPSFQLFNNITSSAVSTSSKQSGISSVTSVTISVNNNGNRDSIGGSSSLVSGTTDSTASEEEPPPLPVKTRGEADYCNLPDDGLYSPTITSSPVARVRNKPVPPVPVDDTALTLKPPTPPPKRPALYKSASDGSAAT